MIIPTVTQVNKTGKEAVDILSLDFTENRTIYLFETITDSVAVAIIAQLAYLDSHALDIVPIYADGLEFGHEFRECHFKELAFAPGLLEGVHIGHTIEHLVA